MTDEQIVHLIDQYRAGRLTAEEQQTWWAWLENEGSREKFRELATPVMLSGKERTERPDAVWDKLSQHILQSDKTGPAARRIHFLKTAWFRYAAILLLLAGISTAVYLNTSSPSFRRNPEVAGLQPARDIAPGSNKALLTIGNNTPIDLSDTKTGIQVHKTITYNDGEKIADAGQMLALTTPRGGQYQAVLPDGTKVWLNAASSIIFPSKFDGKERTVQITGEVYLEVAADKSKPFYAKAGSETIQVLGTSFNVNAYADEPAARTSLLEGSIRIGNTILKPGQAYIGEKAVATNIEQDIAWKNGAFAFDNTPLPALFRQIARWYDVEVVYPKGMPAEKMSGKLDRNITLSGLIKGLKNLGIDCHAEGRQVIVMP